MFDCESMTPALKLMPISVTIQKQKFALGNLLTYLEKHLILIFCGLNVTLASLAKGEAAVRVSATMTPRSSLALDPETWPHLAIGGEMSA